MYDDGQKHISIGQQSPWWTIAICGFNELFAPKKKSGKIGKIYLWNNLKFFHIKKKSDFSPVEQWLLKTLLLGGLQ